MLSCILGAQLLWKAAKKSDRCISTRIAQGLRSTRDRESPRFFFEGIFAFFWVLAAFELSILGLQFKNV